MSVLLSELMALIEQLRFTNDRADLRSGKHWTVYVHPWPAEQEDHFDALISITPNSPEADPSQGFILQVECGERVWQSERKTNHRVQAWFKHLPRGSFTARLGKAISAAINEPVLTLAAGEELDEGSDDVPSFRSAEDIRSSPRIRYYLPDRRITALLEKSKTGKAVITFETKAPELNGAVIRLSVGDEIAEVRLIPSRGAWSGYCNLKQDFQLARQEVPIFKLLLLAES